MTDKRILFTTVPDRATGERLARALVEGRLAACINIIPGVFSIYEWKDAIETSEELLLLIKTRVDLLPAAQELIGRLHPYEVPEMIVTGIEQGGLPYLQWMDQVLGTRPENGK
jgi:periplasmic divalent cation tolerance protein